MAKHGNIKDKSWGDINPSTNHMWRWTAAGKQKPGLSSSEGLDGPRKDIKPDEGGHVAFVRDGSKKGREMPDNGKPHGNMFGAGPQEPGQSASAGNRQDGFAKGGTTSMFGNRGSQRAEPGCTAPSPR